MRLFKVGFLLLITLLASPAFGKGEAEGFVEQIGFGRSYRPECWTPMLVNLTSKLSEPAEYDIVVEQEDLDSDTVVFTRRVTLNAGAQDKFWVYFLPRTTTGSLPGNQADLAHALRVTLVTPGGTIVTPLPLSTPVDNIDDRSTGSGRGTRLVLVVMGQDGNMPGLKDYEGALGLIEDVQFQRVGTADLPENELGYSGVDAVLWLNADAADLTRAGSRKLPALERYVRLGGQLVVCQTNERARIETFAPLLPVEIKRGDDWVVELRDRAVPEPLHALATPDDRTRPEDDHWRKLKGPFKVAHAPAKAGAVVDYWVSWDDPAKDGKVPPARNGTPFVARLGQGLGAVTWVAQDLSSPTIQASNVVGWAHIWDTVFGWRNETRTADTVWLAEKRDLPAGDLGHSRAKAAVAAFKTDRRVNIGRSVLEGTDHLGKAGLYVTLAVFFFIGYWVVAGPGSYALLAGKGRKHLSWGAFAVSALGATLLTVGVVKLVLRGDPEVRHFTVVRQAQGEDAVALSRIGLYIPRDGMQTVSLPEVSPAAVSTLHAMTLHPRHLTVREGFLDTGRYAIPVRDEPAPGEPVEVSFPYRSTLKKIQAERVGPIAGGIAGSLSIVPGTSERDAKTNTMVRKGYLQGRLVNQTGADLRNVFIAFRFDATQDVMLYVPAWGKGTAIDAEAVVSASRVMTNPTAISVEQLPGSNRSYFGFVPSFWAPLFHRKLEGSSSAMQDGTAVDPEKIRLNLVVLSLFDRLKPERSDPQRTRADLLRREGRDLDLSPALAAGRVLILAESRDVPLPFPLEVEGDTVAGEGSVYYQFVLPADRTKKDAEDAAGDAEGVKPDDADVEPAVEK